MWLQILIFFATFFIMEFIEYPYQQYIPAYFQGRLPENEFLINKSITN